jgi:hypothetical protein
MSTLYLFAIGGTGSRVLRSLTMLLAAGVKPKTGKWEIKPVIIDPHVGNKDLDRTRNLMGQYNKIRSKLGAGSENTFFRTEISPMIEDKYVFDVKKYIGVNNEDKSTEGKKFSQTIAFSDMAEVSKSSQDLAEILFSGYSGGEKIINLSTENGFIGNPNLGCIVLNKVAEDIITHLSNASDQKGDRIFIICSIFGGTGAAGFPLLLKTIREKGGNAKDLMIGALVVLPYFNLEPGDGRISSKDFWIKTKSALAYYDKTVNQKIDAIYNVMNIWGDKIDNDPGEKGQQDPAHWIELAGATAIVDFLSLGKGTKKFADFALERDIDQPIKFRDPSGEKNESGYALMHGTMEREICLPLAQFSLFWRYAEDRIMKLKNIPQPWQGMETDIISKITWENFFEDTASNDFYKELKKFFNMYENWLGELAITGQKFEIFDMEKLPKIEIKKFKRAKKEDANTIDEAKANELLRDIMHNRKASGRFFNLLKFAYEDYDRKMNKLIAKEEWPSKFKDPQSRFIKVFFEGTKVLLKERYKLHQS